MSLKSTLAHGDNWHFYETFEEPGLMFLRVDGVTVTVSKDLAKGLLVALEKLEARDWVLYSDEDGNTPDAIDNQIRWLEEQLHKKKMGAFAAKLEDGLDLSGPLAVPGPKYVDQDWSVDDEGDLTEPTDLINDRDNHSENCTANTPHCAACGYCEIYGSCVCYAR